MAATVYAGLYQRLVQSSSLRVTDSTQLDTILPFLQTVPAETFLGTYTTTQSIVVIKALSTEPPLRNQQGTRAILAMLVQRTVRPWSSRVSVQGAAAKATEIVECIPLPLKSGAVLRQLSILGTSLASAAMKRQYHQATVIPPRTPTECLVALLDELDAAATSTTAVQQLDIINKIKNHGEDSRLRNRMEIDSIKSFLELAAGEFASGGLEQLQSSACSLLKELKSHRLNGPPTTRLHDNIYGRVWESIINATLVDDMPPKVLESVQILQNEFSELIDRMPDHLEHMICGRIFTSLAAESSRSWLDRDSCLRNFINLTNPNRQDLLNLFSGAVTNGQKANIVFFMGMKLFLAFQDAAPGYFSWTPARAWYEQEIVSMKGAIKFTEVASGHWVGSGITLAHQPPIDDEPASMRPVVNRVWDLDASREAGTTSPNMLALRCGLSYCTGISGCTFLYARFCMDVTRRGRKLDVPHALLGLFIYLVHSGGHTWHECLQTVNYLESQLGIGILPEHKDPNTYVSDYAQFISIFDGTTTKEYLTAAVQHANKMTILYRRKHLSSGY